jgi:hypothetical protein
MKNVLLLFLAMSAGIAGCGRPAGSGARDASVAMSTAKPGMAEIASAPPAGGPFAGLPNAPAKEDGQDGGGAVAAPAEKKAAAQRKIKYVADINLIVDDFAKAQTDLIQRVDGHKGIIARSDISVSPGSAKVGTWKIRIPVADFRAFCDEVLQLGEVQKNATDSEDLTERFTDLKSHIKNRQDHLTELTKLRDKGGELKYLLTVHNEISAVQLEIDRIQGQINLITNLTDLTTVNITIHERQKFIKDKPPESVEKPNFTTRAGKTFGDSTEALVDFGQNLAILGVGLAPWLPIVLVLALPTWLVLRRSIRNGKVVEVPVAEQASEKTPRMPKPD